MQVLAETDSVDVQTFQFKLRRKVQIFDPSYELPSTRLDLVAAASQFGLLFLGSPDKTLRVLQTNDLVQGTDIKCPQRILPLPSVPVHLSLNCDNELLSVVLHKNDTPVVVIYNTRSFITENPIINREIRLSTSRGVQLCSLLWNPCQADSLAICMSDGSLSMFQCKPNSMELQTKITNARCLSWSPKGKQIVTGNYDGTLSQFKPDLTLVKSVPAPDLFDSKATQVLAIHWISNYQFNVVYNDALNAENRACVTIVNTPKIGNINCVNYDDICYSSGCIRENQFFLIHMPTWGILLASSANSMEIGVLGTTDQTNWQQWIQMDEGRAELPLTDNKQENYPVGVCLDNVATIQLPWGESTTLPHMPMIHILSHTGVLVTFFAVNILENAAQLCKNPELLTLPSNLMTLEPPMASPPNQPPVVEVAKSAPQDFSFLNTITSTPTLPKTDHGGYSNNLISNYSFVDNANNQKLEETDKNVLQNKAHIQQVLNSYNQQTNVNPMAIPNPSEANFISNIMKMQNKNVFGSKPLLQDVTAQNIQKQNFTEAPKNNNIQSNYEEKAYERDVKIVPNSVIKAMLLKEVNEFQLELYELLQRCRGVDIKIIGTTEEMDRISTLLTENDHEPLKKLWSNEEFKKQIFNLKHNLISTCAFITEAKMQPESLELEHLVQLDPVSSAKMSSIRTNSYYVQSQLEQINSVLNEEWETFQKKCQKKSMALRGVSEKDFMKIPTLDKIYQPLLKEADILAKQQLTVATLQKTIAALIKSGQCTNRTGLYKSSGFKMGQKSVPSLTKDLFNLNLSSSDTVVEKEKEHSTKFLKNKNDALRKMLKDYKTVKIKPTKVEIPSMMQSFYDWNTTEIDEKMNTKKEDLAPNSNQINQVSKEIETNIFKLPYKNLPFNNITTAEPQSINTPNFGTSFNATNSPSSQKISIGNPCTSNNFGSPSNPTDFHAFFNPPTAILSNIQTTPEISKEDTEKPKSSISSGFPNNLKTELNGQKPEQDHNIFSAKNTQSSFGVKPMTPSNLLNNKSPVTNIPNTSFVDPTIQKTEKIQINNQPTQIQPNSLQSATSINLSALSIVSEKTENVTPKQSTFSFNFSPQSTVNSSAFEKTDNATPKQSPFSFNFAPLNLPTVSDPPKLTQFGYSGATSVPDKSAFSSSPTVTAISATTSVTNKAIASFPPNDQLKNDQKENYSLTKSSVSSSETNTSNVTVLQINPQPPINVASTDLKKKDIKSDSAVENPANDTNSPNSLTKSSIVTPTLPITNLKSEIKTTLISPKADESEKKPESLIAQVSVISNSETETKTDNKDDKPVIPITTEQKISPDAVAIPKTESVFGFSSKPLGNTSIFGQPVSASLTTNESAPVTTSAIFGTAQQSSTVTSPFNNSSTSAGSIFGSASKTPASPSIFGFPSAVNTCASSLFGAANAAIDTNVLLFGGASISTTSAPPTFGSPTKPTNSVFGGGSVFGGQGQSGDSIFGGISSSFGQPQSSSIFGGSSSLGSFGTATTQASNVFGQSGQTNTTTQSSSIFGQSGQTNNVFGAPSNQSSLFGGNTSSFSSPNPSNATAQPVSLFGSKSPGTSAVFGGSPTFGSKSVFGQPAGFGSSPSGSFGMFSSPDQPNVNQAGFGSPNSFNKPGMFGGSPKFGSSPSFGSPPAFGNNMGSFNSPSGFSTGTQQSTTFENLATQSGLSFGNLAQQTQQPPPSNTPVFQGSSSFSTWR